MNKQELADRTKRFALRVVRLVESLPQSRTAEVIGRQLLRSGTSVGANYRSVCRSRTTADFVSRMSIVEEEADESAYWMELLIEAKSVKAEKIEALLSEAYELVAISAASVITARKRTTQTRQSAIRNQKSEHPQPVTARINA